ncbi:MAG: hydrogenase maturation nickel metallochaperone HypA [Actinobacteria bacterium]|nr:hydrogenase maturation nickel metallochaperone HypA [Actinomycetota bacterium]
MHESGIAEGILKSTLEAAAEAGAVKVNSVDITVGVLTEVMEDALQFAWEAARAASIADGAALNVTMVDARTRCLDCGHEWVHDRYSGAKCPSCEGYLVSLLAGRELRIDSIDID